MLIAALMPMVLIWIQRNGGLGGALSKITGMGHDKQARSWMSNHELNDNLDPNEVNRLFDEQEIQQVAAVLALMRWKCVKVSLSCCLRL